MKTLINFKTTIPLVLIPAFLICFGVLPPNAFGIVPAPDGGYPGGNTAEGQAALLSLTSGRYNTAVGLFSLLSNTEGDFNTATGAGTLLLTTGDENTATGAGALLSNTTGIQNTADGAFALFSNIEGTANTAIGDSALGSNTIGNGNTANGQVALASNTTGGGNTADGKFALASNTTGTNNTAVGFNALGEVTTGTQNTALGIDAGTNVTTADNVICIRHPGANVSGSCYIGNIFGAPVDPSAVFVAIDSTGKLGTTASSKRFKQEIQPMDKASEALLSLKPVTFRYKNYKNSPRQFGLIAEEVAEVNPDLVARDANGEIYTVRYDQINAMLLNEFLKEHRQFETQQATITELKSTVARQQKGMEALIAQLKEQAAQIQKVTAQIEMSKSAPQIVFNP
jgi:hypothetical protein